MCDATTKPSCSWSTSRRPTYEIFNVPAGPVGMLVGARVQARIVRRTTVTPRLDGTIVFTDFQGGHLALRFLDVVNSRAPRRTARATTTCSRRSAELAGAGSREARSATCIALRGLLRCRQRHGRQDRLRFPPARSSSCSGDPGPVRSAAPNLVTINEEIVARQNPRTDWTCVSTPQRTAAIPIRTY